MTRKKNGIVYTFYSYKGGVGRSMALANVATLMSKQGKKVLIIDWDLEAPGLEKYFESDHAGFETLPKKEQFIDRNLYNQDSTDHLNIHGQKPGILDLLLSGPENKEVLWTDCVSKINVLAKTIDFISAGKRDGEYKNRLQSINWDSLFDDHKVGNYLDQLRREWISVYDFILIDSRTGITDNGDLCTVLLPDVLVLLYVTNHQNIEGIKDVTSRARKAHSQLPFDRNRLVFVPIQARDEVYNEYQNSQEWKRKATLELKELFLDWMPRGFTAMEAMDRLFIPYVAIWSFGERLPVAEIPEEVNNPTSISAAYARITELLIHELDWETMIRENFYELSQAKSEAAQLKESEAKTKRRSIVRDLVLVISLLATIITLTYIGTNQNSLTKNDVFLAFANGNLTNWNNGAGKQFFQTSVYRKLDSISKNIIKRTKGEQELEQNYLRQSFGPGTSWITDSSKESIVYPDGVVFFKLHNERDSTIAHYFFQHIFESSRLKTSRNTSYSEFIIILRDYFTNGIKLNEIYDVINPIRISLISENGMFCSFPGVEYNSLPKNEIFDFTKYPWDAPFSPDVIKSTLNNDNGTSGLTYPDGGLSEFTRSFWRSFELDGQRFAIVVDFLFYNPDEE